ncbi:MAG: hypothetical protein COT91_04250 [Candidatus Doudnabacteria bacterium CG10_big_fil_rev_8_21_14_0_10_41_10]|uniref:Transposase IS200-like domain-containing protein n=1 Tax=Candidatus Doudnabacteria bacterium CG10_big_fil_rev_8_21_14_0_10_41_10 TaxID=1974551 RepID=A0A2H0VF36_9BACT|nr:MAG: hypothetical protein COT91_04250 [Candidatus Doudnabacteria bacterium CG10_big_fil_rev_8_21_14_0_10_41_10]
MERKANRLGLENYRTTHAYYLTLNCHNRESYFTKKRVVKSCLADLQRSINRFQAKLWVYCFMPDHLHLLCESDNCLGFLKLFKQTSGYNFKKKTIKVLWQKSFYDHILRS